MKPKVLSFYGLRYTLAYVLASLVVSAVFYLLQWMSIDIGSGSGAGVGIAIGGAMYPMIRFLGDYNRLPNAAEYWSLVLVFTVIGLALEAAKLVGVAYIFGLPLLADDIWPLALTIAGVFLLLTNMFVLSKFFTGPQLKRIHKKLAEKA